MYILEAFTPQDLIGALVYSFFMGWMMGYVWRAFWQWFR